MSFDLPLMVMLPMVIMVAYVVISEALAFKLYLKHRPQRWFYSFWLQIQNDALSMDGSRQPEEIRKSSLYRHYLLVSKVFIAAFFLTLILNLARQIQQLNGRHR